MTLAIDPAALTTAQLAVMILLAAVCVAGMVLHAVALRHRKPGVPRIGQKDSLFRKAEQHYTETGLKLIAIQKRLVVGAMILVVLLFVLSRPPG